ncbi:MAG TPA: hypothetical protein VIS75_07270 [Chitinophagaceae bacterium]
MIMYPSCDMSWPLWKRILFRFFFIFLTLYMAPWGWFDSLLFQLKLSWLTEWYSDLEDWAVRFANAKLFHIKDELVAISGSGDTSWGWAQLSLFLFLAVAGCIIWSILDRKRKSYNKADYWLCLFARYYLALFAFLYGIIKLFALQMTFPNPSLLATPLGDLLPMRLSWMFMGYSTPYQVFSGIMEVLAGILLLSRRTATFGTMLATGVFANVMMMNLSYDIPVKIFSMRLVFMCLFLLAHEYKRIFSFFVLNKQADACSTYNVRFEKKWMRITRVGLKVVFIGVFVGWLIYTTLERYNQFYAVQPDGPIARGIYNVESYVLNRDTIPPLITDTLRWQDFILENGFGSIKTTDSLFRKRYGRAYFNYKIDTVKHSMDFMKSFADTSSLLSLKYEIPGDNTVRLWGKLRSDSLFIVLRKSNRHFQLTERQFHWLSESNR